MTAAKRTRANGEGSVFYDAHGKRWVATITDDDGRRHKRTAPTRKTANTKLRALIDEMSNYGRIASPNATLAELMALWKTKSLEASRSAPSTKATKLWAYDWIGRYLGSVRLAQLDADRIERALSEMADAGLGRESVIKVRSVLNQICRFGERRDLLRKNPVSVVELPPGMTASDDGRAMTHKQVERLLEVSADHRLHALVCTMVMLGLRPGEALGLAWDCVDLNGGVLHVRRALRQGDDGLEITDELKTARSRRSLELPSPVIDALIAHRALQDRERAEATEIEQWSTEWPELVFTTHFGTPIHPSNLRREFAQLTERAGIGRWTPNELRHTAVSLLSADGLALERIADVVGHSGTRMTAKVYRHVLTPSVSDAVGPMNKLFGATPHAAQGDGIAS